MTGKKVSKPKKDNQVNTTLPVRVDPQLLLSQAIQKQLPLEQMERLLAMRKELKEEWAKEQYYIALSLFQSECPIIKKAQKVDFTSKRTGNRTKYNYATFDMIISQTKNIMEKYGFSYSFSTEQTDGYITAICHAHHRDGYSSETTLTVPIDKEAFMSAPQKVASALTYAKRYAFCDAFGIGTGDEDDDATECNGDNQDEVQKTSKSSNKPKQKLNGVIKITKEQRDCAIRMHEYMEAKAGSRKGAKIMLEGHTSEHLGKTVSMFNDLEGPEIDKLWEFLKDKVIAFEKATLNAKPEQGELIDQEVKS